MRKPLQYQFCTVWWNSIENWGCETLASLDFDFKPKSVVTNPNRMYMYKLLISVRTTFLCFLPLSAFRFGYSNFTKANANKRRDVHVYTKLKNANCLEHKIAIASKSIQMVSELAGRLAAVGIMRQRRNGKRRNIRYIWCQFYVSRISVQNGKSNKISGNAEQYENYYISIVTYIMNASNVCVCVLGARVIVLSEHFEIGWNHGLPNLSNVCTSNNSTIDNNIFHTIRKYIISYYVWISENEYGMIMNFFFRFSSTATFEYILRTK